VSDPIEPIQQVRGLQRALYLLGGSVALLLAVVGSVLPLIPATPFLILAVALFARSSPWMHDLLLRSRVFGPYIHDWRTYRAIRPHVRVVAVVAVLTGVGATCFLGQAGLPLKVLTIVAGIIGLVVVFRLPVRKRHQEVRPKPVISSENTGSEVQEQRTRPAK